MELYILDDDYQKTEVIDNIVSLIWTERYQTSGDFELTVFPTPQMLEWLYIGRHLIHAETNVPMRIITSNVKTDDSGRRVFVLTGKTLDVDFSGRYVTPDWVAVGPTAFVVTELVKKIVVLGTDFSPNDVIPNLGTINGDPDGEQRVDVVLEFKDLLSVVQDLVMATDHGYSFYLRSFNPRFAFKVYKGIDRPELVFDPEMDTLMSPEYLRSMETYKNIAYVEYQKTTVVTVTTGGTTAAPNYTVRTIVYGTTDDYSNNAVTTPGAKPESVKDSTTTVKVRRIIAKKGVDIDIKGTERRVMSVDATDIDPTKFTSEKFTNYVERRGAQALAKQKFVRSFDGEVPPTAPFKLGVDFFIGDVGMFAGENGAKQKVRVTEHIWALDEEGEHKYPTLEAV